MGSAPRYHRVLIKLSGEAFCAPDGLGIQLAAVESIVGELAPVVKSGMQLGVVVGAGNIIRGRQLVPANNIHSTTADYMGMLGTVINALAMRDMLQASGIGAAVMSAIRMPLVCEPYYRPRAMEYIEAGRVVIFAAGTGHPGVTTDMCAAIRSAEIEADILMKATKVDGVFDSDPIENPNARKYDRLGYEKVLADRLGVMDLPAMAFCREQKIPILVFNMLKRGNFEAAVKGEELGTLISGD